jgi:hypothetical protein
VPTAQHAPPAPVPPPHPPAGAPPHLVAAPSPALATRARLAVAAPPAPATAAPAPNAAAPPAAAAARAPATPPPAPAPPAAPRAALLSGLSLDAHEALAAVHCLEEQGSHTLVPSAAPELHGNWQVNGPAVVRRVGGSLQAVVRRGGWVCLGAALDTVLSTCDAPGGAPGEPPPAGEAAAFRLHAVHAELSGPFELLIAGGPGARELGRRVVLTVPALSERNCILLLPGGRLSHPLCMTPAGER